jgi:hypothetical protein
MKRKPRILPAAQIAAHPLIQILGISAFVLPCYSVLYKVLISKINGFGCFDECINFGGGFFMTYGKPLYSQIYFDHQPMMAVVSFLIQKVTDPGNITELLLRHYQFLFIYSMGFAVLLIYRYRLSAVLFLVSYELTKYYLFGTRFLGESFLIYPLVYLMGAAMEKLRGKTLTSPDYILVAIFTWFILFTREPYSLGVLLLFLVIILPLKMILPRVSLGIFAVLTLITLALLPFREYIFSILTVNYQANIAGELQSSHFFGSGIIMSFFYPLALFVTGTWNLFHIFLIGISVVFCLIIANSLLKKKQYQLVLLVFLVLGLLNLRFREPGTVFYAGYRMLPWYSAFLFTTLYLLQTLLPKRRKYYFTLLAVFLMSFGIYLIRPENVIFHKTDPQTEYIINFGRVHQIGNVVAALSRPGQTFFIDGVTDLQPAYFISRRLPDYQYSWYAYQAQSFPVYRDAREEMFRNNPPDFYYGYAPPEGVPGFNQLPHTLIGRYEPLYSEMKESNLFVKKSIVSGITPDQWTKAREFRYEASISAH